MINLDIPHITEYNKLNVIKFLIQNDVYPDKPNKNNNTPLHLACEKQYASIVKYLLELGVNPNFTDSMNNTAFHYLLTGSIRLQEPSRKVTDFIPVNSDREYKISLVDKLEKKKVDNNDIYKLNIVSQHPTKENFIVYMNDFTNTSILKVKSEIYINKDIIKLLLEYGANPYLENVSGQSAIFNILKNYNYRIMRTLQKYDIDFNKFHSDEPLKFMEREYKNNRDKLFGNKTNLSDILSSITASQYNEFRLLILNNPRFGNNIIKNYEKSFNIIAYKTFEILSNHLNKSEREEMSKVKQITFDPINKPITNKDILTSDMKEDNDTELQSITEIMDDDDNKKCKYDEKARLLNKNRIINKIQYTNNNIIDNYNAKINELYRYIKTYDLSILHSNNLILLYEDNPILLKSISCYCEKYFMKDKFIKSNKQLDDIYKFILKEYTEKIICDSIVTLIEIIMDKFIFNNNYMFINKVLNNYFSNGESIDNIIYENARKIIKSCLNIFTDIDELNKYKQEDIKDILMDIINNIRNSMTGTDRFYDTTTGNIIPLNSQGHTEITNSFIELLSNEVLIYFDTIIPKLLSLWHVIIENIFKYYINHNRIVQIINILKAKR